MTGVLLRRGETNEGECHVKTQRNTGKIPCDDTGRDWSGGAASQGMPRNDSYHQSYKEARILLSILDGAWSCRWSIS